jgi:hypothetical protein
MDDGAVSSQPRFSGSRLRSQIITANPSARSPIVLVLGMRNSGILACSRLLSALGIEMSDQVVSDSAVRAGGSNLVEAGEQSQVSRFHDRILALFNRDAMASFHDLPLPVGWWSDFRVVQIRREMTNYLEQQTRTRVFGFSDTRTGRLLPLWRQIADELELVPKIVLCLSNPGDISRASRERNGLDQGLDEYNWLVHTLDFFRYVGSFDYCTIEYGKWFSKPRDNAAKLTRFLDLRWQWGEVEFDRALSVIIDRAAGGMAAYPKQADQPLVRTVYRLATRAAEDITARDQLSHIVSEFVTFQQLQEPFLRAIGTLGITKDPAAKQETELLKAIGERDLALTLVKEAETRAKGAMEYVFRGEMEVLRKALSRSENEAKERQAQLSARDIEISTLREAVASARLDAQKKVDEIQIIRTEMEMQKKDARASLEAMRAEVTTLNGTLEQSRAQNAALQSELQREAEEGRAAASEILSLHAQVAAARRVGRELAIALRTNFLPVRGRNTDTPDRWWRGMLRLLPLSRSLRGDAMAAFKTAEEDALKLRAEVTRGTSTERLQRRR